MEEAAAREVDATRELIPLPYIRVHAHARARSRARPPMSIVICAHGGLLLGHLLPSLIDKAVRVVVMTLVSK